MALADHLSPEDKVKYFEETYHPIQVYRLYCTFTTPPKEKLLILVSVTPSPVLLYINTNIPARYTGKPHLYDRQILMSQADHPSILRHDSYIDCAQVITQLSKDNIQGQVLADMNRILGEIPDDTRQAIVKEILRSRPIEARLKNRIYNELQIPSE